MLNKNSPGKRTGAIKKISDSPELLLPEFVGDRKLVTSFAATTGQHLAAVGRLHALAETVYGLPATAMGLKCTFHFVSALTRCCKIGRENDPVTHSIHRSPHPWICERMAKVRNVL